MEVRLNTDSLHRIIKYQDKIDSSFKKKVRTLRLTAGKSGLEVSFEDDRFKVVVADVPASVLEEGKLEILTEDLKTLPKDTVIAIGDNTIYGGGIAKTLRTEGLKQFYIPCTQDEHLEVYEIDSPNFFKCLERVKYPTKKTDRLPFGQFVRFTLEGYMYSLDGYRISWAEGAGYMHDAVIPRNALDFLEQLNKDKIHNILIAKNSNSLVIEVPELKTVAEFKLFSEFKSKIKEFDNILDNFMKVDKGLMWETEVKAKALITALKNFDTKDTKATDNKICIDTTADTLKIEQESTALTTQSNTVSRVYCKECQSKVYVNPNFLKQALDSYKKIERVDDTVYANLRYYKTQGSYWFIKLEQKVYEEDIKAYDLILPVRVAEETVRGKDYGR